MSAFQAASVALFGDQAVERRIAAQESTWFQGPTFSSGWVELKGLH